MEPEHLAWGSPRQNVLDSLKANRSAAKLTRYQVERIRADYAAGAVTQRSLAATYGVAVQTINAVVRGRTWTWLLPPPDLTEINTMNIGYLTERLPWLSSEPNPSDADKEHVVRWVLRTASRLGLTPTELVDDLLAAAPHVSDPDEQYVATVLNLAARWRVTTSEASARLNTAPRTTPV